MRQVSPLAADAIEAGSFEARLQLTAFYGAEVTLADVPVASWSLSSEEGRDVPTVGTLDAVYVDEQGNSVTPRSFTDYLAPFGQEVLARLVIGDDEVLPLGRLRIIETPDSSDSNVLHGSRVITAASRVRLEVADLLDKVRHAGFTGPTSPRHQSCWAELAHLTGMRLARSVDDKTMPRIEYEISTDGRLKACQEIAAHLGGTLYVRSDGALTVLPKATGPVVRRIPVGGLRLSEMRRALSTDGIFNEVVGIFEDADRNPLWVPPERITSGPLSVDGPLGRRTRYLESRMVKDLDEARRTVRAALKESSTLASVEIDVELVLDPRLEIGDTVQLERDDETLTGRITKAAHSPSKTSLTVAVTAMVPEPNLERANAID
ncbi:hypothetical protein [Pseudoclavibacter terrae]|uniref:Uncharacterized protein n=1 Tax=Pseudoclavibacter terrae TaxID=1530195 RepID=A0A7J5B8A7_9MICO|nr:hypothetical protein [Pseudoclavibacter terrae]KAB1639871.1 hypothetical protein F8O03_06060 [Pseudoclavibacter terrae]